MCRALSDRTRVRMCPPLVHSIASYSPSLPLSLSAEPTRAESLRCGVKGESSHGDGRLDTEPDELTNQIGGWVGWSTRQCPGRTSPRSSVRRRAGRGWFCLGGRVWQEVRYYCCCAGRAEPLLSLAFSVLDRGVFAMLDPGFVGREEEGGWFPSGACFRCCVRRHAVVSIHVGVYRRAWGGSGPYAQRGFFFARVEEGEAEGVISPV